MSNENVTQEIKYGSCWARIIASILDEIIISIIASIPFFIAGALAMEDAAAFFWGDLWWSIVTIVYVVKLVASERQGTFAMGWFNLMVVDKNMQRLSLGHSFGRFLALIFVAIFTICLGFLTAVFRKDKRGLHDIIAKTYVICK